VLAIVLAAQAKKSSGSSALFFILLLGLGAVVYFVILRPRTQRQRQTRQQAQQAGVGDEVVTIGGLVCTIVAEDGDRVTVSANGNELVFLRQAILRKAEPPAGSAPPDPELEGPPPGFDGPSESGDSSGDETEHKKSSP
jgi:preprotein translocase YajC subunit